MRTYLILKERARAFDADPEAKSLMAEKRDARIDPCLRGYSRDKAKRLRELEHDPDALARAGLGYERLDQILMEHLLGARS
jgi:xylose isomerase